MAGIRRKRIFIGYQFGAPYQGTNYRSRWFFAPTLGIYMVLRAGHSRYNRAMYMNPICV